MTIHIGAAQWTVYAAPFYNIYCFCGLSSTNTTSSCNDSGLSGTSNMRMPRPMHRQTRPKSPIHLTNRTMRNPACIEQPLALPVVSLLNGGAYIGGEACGEMSREGYHTTQTIFKRPGITELYRPRCTCILQSELLSMLLLVTSRSTSRHEQCLRS